MTEQVETVTPDQNEPKTITTIDHSAASSTNCRFKNFMKFLLALILLALLSYLFLEVAQLKRNLEPNALLKQDNLLLEELAKQQKKLATQYAFMQKQQETGQDTLKTLQNDFELLKSERNKQGILLPAVMEYKFLVERAHFKLIVEQDPKGALAILKLLSKKSKTNQAVHAQVQLVLADLAPYATVNLTELIKKLQNLEITLIKQPLRLKQSFGEKQNLLSSKTKQTKSLWKDEFLESVKDIIVIQRLDRPVKPILNAYEKALLQYEFKLKIKQTEMALLSNQFSLFSETLLTLKKIAGDYIDYHKANELEKQFDELLAYSFPSKWPNFSALKKTINQLKAN